MIVDIVVGITIMYLYSSLFMLSLFIAHVCQQHIIVGE